MNDTVTGLILSQSDYRDYDILLRVMTREYGLISFIAAGAKKMTSKNAGSILPLTKADIQFDYREGRTLFRLKTARTASLYRKIHEDLVIGAAAGVTADACAHLCGENTADAAKEYELLETAWNLYEEGHSHMAVTALYLSDLMKLNGLSPDADECVRCGSTRVSAISAEEGGFLCADCAEELSVPFSSVTDLKSFRLIVKGGLAHIDVIEPAKPGIRETEILAEMLRLHAGVELRSFAFYKRLLCIEPLS